MEAQIGRGMSPEERLDLLQSNADEVEIIKYKKSLSNDELDGLKGDLVHFSTENYALQEKKKEIVSSYNSQIKELRKNIKNHLKVINDEGEEVEENCFKFINHEESMVAWYNDEGTMVHSRKIRPAERQTTAFGGFKVLKTGTND